MKVLILSCNTGGGHNSVAAALRELFESHGESCTIADALSFLPHRWSQITSRLHSYIYRSRPGLFRKGYRHAETHRGQFVSGHAARNIIDLGVTRLGEYICDNGYDTVLCAHVFAGVMLTDAVRKFDLSVTTGIVETDYTVSPGSENSNLDWHFVPTREQKAELLGYGIDEQGIVVSGIPVRAQFTRSAPREEAKRSFGLDEGKKHVLMICGSMGCGPMEQLLDELVRRWDGSFEITAVCGTNTKLKEWLTQLYEGRPGVFVRGRVEDMSLLLDSADVYLTKPGGISTTEAACKRVPMVLINAVGGCEQHNMDFFTGAGGAVSADTVEELAGKALEIASDERLHRKMEAGLAAAFSENDPERIYRAMNRRPVPLRQ